MKTTKLFIDGMHGTTGLQIVDKLAPYKDRFDLEVLSDQERKDTESRKRALNSADIAVLCLPDAAARESVALIDNPHTRVLDASSAHRVSDGWVYGLAEMSPEQPQRIAHASRVSNPGCYPVGVILLLRTLTRRGWLRGGVQVVVAAVSGYTGGGRQLIERFESEPGTVGHIEAPFLRYGMFAEHKHVKEMTRYSGLERPPVFMPSIGRYRQGIISQVPLLDDMLAQPVSSQTLREAYLEDYGDSKFVKCLNEQETLAQDMLAPTLYCDTNNIQLSVNENRELGQIVLTSTYDNLGKGASGSAVQNLLLMTGEREH